MRIRPRSVAAAVAATGLLAAVAGHAATRTLVFQANASGPCQAALPAFEGLIRKRPAALQNEGDNVAFITCSPDTLQNLPSEGDRYGMLFRNLTAAPVTVNCTAVFADGAGNAAWSLVKSVAIAANATNQVWWSGVDNVPENNLMTFNTSCALPPGVGITTLLRIQSLDVGT